ncbi:MAG TPA: hypothetical protein DHV48_10980 [Prolixibacteraceae bacterium]|nr:hypothetical protein [Prolixibacteraceae bacterium]
MQVIISNLQEPQNIPYGRYKYIKKLNKQKSACKTCIWCGIKLVWLNFLMIFFLKPGSRQGENQQFKLRISKSKCLKFNKINMPYFAG